jgi:hypothetical protein
VDFFKMPAASLTSFLLSLALAQAANAAEPPALDKESCKPILQMAAQRGLAGIPCRLLIESYVRGMVTRDEVARVVSPTGDVEAVLCEINGGATTSFAYGVYVVPRGAKLSDRAQVASFYAATRSGSAYGVNLRWQDPKTLAIEYLEAESAEIDQPSVTVDKANIAVMLRGGIADPAAPRGSMYRFRNGGPCPALL